MEEVQEYQTKEQTQPQSNIGEAILDWEYPEFIQFERGWRWYGIAAVVAAALVYYAIASQNWLFLIIIILSTVIFTIANIRPPERLHIIVTTRGVVLRDKFLPYEEIKNFWMIYQPPHVKSLYLEPRSFFLPRLHIHLETQNPVAIRDILLQYLEEDIEKEDEPQSDFFGRLLKL